VTKSPFRGFLSSIICLDKKQKTVDGGQDAQHA
jgi:hypothetical protein